MSNATTTTRETVAERAARLKQIQLNAAQRKRLAENDEVRRAAAKERNANASR